jgi:uncharacterized protein YlzI (FlbEa/FlbD family)
MITLTARNNVRCSLRPELVASVVAGPPTTVMLTSGLALEVRESVAEVERRLERARRATEAAAVGVTPDGGTD